jgi:cytochrome P450
VPSRRRRGSPHRCLGGHLARLEMRALMRDLLPVLRWLEPDGMPVRIRSNISNGLKRFAVQVS